MKRDLSNLSEYISVDKRSDRSDRGHFREVRSDRENGPRFILTVRPDRIDRVPIKMKSFITITFF